MKAVFLLNCLLVLISLAQPANAEIKFRCDANVGDECAFSVVHPDGSGMTNFVLARGEIHGLNDNFAGGRYCVVVSKPHAQIRDWPPNCVNAADGTKGKVAGSLQVGTTYN